MRDLHGVVHATAVKKVYHKPFLFYVGISTYIILRVDNHVIRPFIDAIITAEM